MFKIPLFDLNYGKEELIAVQNVLEDKWISSGPKCMELENTLQDMFGVKHALAVTNCTAALHLAMIITGIKEGDEVIVPSLTFVATANAVRYVGATPVFCDVESCERPVIDPTKIKELVNDRTKAIVVMHYGGFACDMDPIMEIADKNGLVVIEDACHGPLSEYKGKKLGTIGNVGCFSFFSNKNISTGEGGAIITNDDGLFNKAKLLRSHGMTSLSYERSSGHATEYDVVELGYNYRMDDIRAALGIVQLKKLGEDIKRRIVVRNRYIDNLKDVDEVIVPFQHYSENCSSYIFPIILKNNVNGSHKRDKVRDYLKNKGIQTSVHYPAVDSFNIYHGYGLKSLPNTRYIAENEISLPMFGKLSFESVDYVCRSLNEAIYKISRIENN